MPLTADGGFTRWRVSIKKVPAETELPAQRGVTYAVVLHLGFYDEYEEAEAAAGVLHELIGASINFENDRPTIN